MPIFFLIVLAGVFLATMAHAEYHPGGTARPVPYVLRNVRADLVPGLPSQATLSLLRPGNLVQVELAMAPGEPWRKVWLEVVAKGRGRLRDPLLQAPGLRTRADINFLPQHILAVRKSSQAPWSF